MRRPCRLRPEVAGDGTLHRGGDLRPVVDITPEGQWGEHLLHAGGRAGQRLAGDLPDLRGLPPAGVPVGVGDPDHDRVRPFGAP